MRGLNAGGITSVISGTIGAILSSNAQRDAARKNQQAARELNELNYRMFLEGRGSTGSALLPLYFQGREKALAQDAMQFYDQSQALLGTPAQQLERYQQAIGAYHPLIDKTRGTLEDVYSGNLTTARLAALEPVSRARTGLAQTQRQGILQGLQERINALNASSTGKGYSGSGSFAQNRLLGATVAARQAAAGAEALAGLENRMDERGIYDDAANLRLQYMNLPMQQAQQALAMEMMPLNQVQANFSRSMQPFEFFRMGPGQFQAQPLPMQQANSPWPAAMAGIGNANLGLANIFAGRQGINNAQAYQAGTYGAQLPQNWGALNANQQGQYMNLLQNAAAYQGPAFE